MIQRALSMLQRDEMDAWMRPVWSDIRGASLRDGHPAPFPAEIAERLIRMFSFAGDTVLDPFAGSGSTAVAAIKTGRNRFGRDRRGISERCDATRGQGSRGSARREPQRDRNRDAEPLRAKPPRGEGITPYLFAAPVSRSV